jgi:hypothetical protein
MLKKLREEGFEIKYCVTKHAFDRYIDHSKIPIAPETFRNDAIRRIKKSNFFHRTMKGGYAYGTQKWTFVLIFDVDYKNHSAVVRAITCYPTKFGKSKRGIKRPKKNRRQARIRDRRVFRRGKGRDNQIELDC